MPSFSCYDSDAVDYFLNGTANERDICLRIYERRVGSPGDLYPQQWTGYNYWSTRLKLFYGGRLIACWLDGRIAISTSLFTGSRAVTALRGLGEVFDISPNLDNCHYINGHLWFPLSQGWIYPVRNRGYDIVPSACGLDDDPINYRLSLGATARPNYTTVSKSPPKGTRKLAALPLP